MRDRKLSTGIILLLGGLVGAMFLTGTRAAAQTETVVFNFDTTVGDLYWPYAGLVADASGNLYGTTNFGGVYGDGGVIELAPATGGGWTQRFFIASAHWHGWDLRRRRSDL